MPGPYEYVRPTTQAEALELLSSRGHNAVPMVISPKPFNPRTIQAGLLVDMSLLGLDSIEKDENGNIHIGSLATLHCIIESPLLQKAPNQLLIEAAELVATPGIRNLSSLWGCLQAQGGPPEVLLALMALGARAIFLGKDGFRREFPVTELVDQSPNIFPEGRMMVEVILTKSEAGWALERVARTPKDEAIVAAALCMDVEHGKMKNVSIAIAGIGPKPRMFEEAKKLLAGNALDVKLAETVAEKVKAQAKPVTDFRAGEEYRRAMAGLVVRRALEKTWKRAGGEA